MVVYISEELKSAYTISGGELLQAHIKDSLLNTEAFDYIDYELIGDELVSFEGSDVPFSEVWSIVKNRLENSASS